MQDKLKDIEKIAGLACSNGCFVTTITLMAISALGLECLDWEPEVVVDAFEREYGIKRLPQRSCDKLQTGLMLVGTNAFTSTIEGFLAAVKVMNNRRFDQSEAPYVDISMCSWAIYEYMQLMGEAKDGKPTEEFSPDIITYIQEAGKVNGVTKFPVWMSFADSEAGMPDLSGDVDLFEMYTARQADYDSMMTDVVNRKQGELAQQLKLLRDSGVFAGTEKNAPETA